MTILIEKTKKIILGLLVAGLAVGFSAFTIESSNSKSTTGIYRYYNTTGEPSTDRSDFIYQEDDFLCADKEEKVCSEEWNLGNEEPIVGQAPPLQAAHVSGSMEPGLFAP